MIVKMFKPQFADLVARGIKCQTIRPMPKRHPKNGDILSCRRWADTPYRSKQIILLEAPLIDFCAVSISEETIVVENKVLINREEDHLAKADGFESAKELRDWF